MARPPAIERETAVRIVLDVSSVGITDDQYFRLCRDNRDLRIEMTAQKKLIIMSPTNMETGRKNAKIAMRLGIWAEQDSSGECFDSSSEFTLPNGAKLGWLLDPMDNRAYIYRPGRPVEQLDKPGILAGIPVLSGFKFDFKEIL